MDYIKYRPFVDDPEKPGHVWREKSDAYTMETLCISPGRSPNILLKYIMDMYK